MAQPKSKEPIQMDIDFGEKYNKIILKEHQKIEDNLLKMFANLGISIETVNQVMAILKAELAG